MTLNNSLMQMMNVERRRSRIQRSAAFGRAFLGGAAVGAGVLWLFGTERGNEVRHRLVERGQRLLNGEGFVEEEDEFESIEDPAELEEEDRSPLGP